MSRRDKILIDEELLRRLHGECDGYVERMHEKLVEEEEIDIGYSTLTRKVRELDLGVKHKARCDRVPDEPGAEMQHDTSPYRIKMGGKLVGVVASLQYLRYTARARKSRPWDRQKMNPSYADMVTALRREFWVWRISRYPSLRGVRRKLEGLVGLWLPAA